jgi:hypothetical protein
MSDGKAPDGKAALDWITNNMSKLQKFFPETKEEAEKFLKDPKCVGFFILSEPDYVVEVMQMAGWTAPQISAFFQTPKA